MASDELAFGHFSEQQADDHGRHRVFVPAHQPSQQREYEDRDWPGHVAGQRERADDGHHEDGGNQVVEGRAHDRTGNEYETQSDDEEKDDLDEVAKNDGVDDVQV